MIKVKGYHHVAIVVKDLEKSKWFYGEVLGLKSLDRPPFDFPGHWYQVGQTGQLHLMVYDEEIPQTMRHFALEVDDFEGTLKQLQTEGIQISEGPGKRIDGSDYAFCHDPNGNLIEITKH
jgi:glyoxylase I family protein